MPRQSLITLPLLAVALAGCGGKTAPKPVPDVRGERLDIAEERLDARGFDWEEIGGGNLGILVRSHWQVCDQVPRPGRRGTTVRLVVERTCPNMQLEPPVVPDVVGLSLEDANDELDELRIGHDTQPEEGETPIVEHLWEVCGQDPTAGERSSFVDLYVERDCDD
jgi:beta-lactam-binding protein with PASTA domain